MAKQEFLETIRSLPMTNRSELFSSVDIMEKINIMSGRKPTEHSSLLRWQVSTQGLRSYLIRV